MGRSLLLHLHDGTVKDFDFMCRSKTQKLNTGVLTCVWVISRVKHSPVLLLHNTSWAEGKPKPVSLYFFCQFMDWMNRTSCTQESPRARHRFAASCTVQHTVESIYTQEPDRLLGNLNPAAPRSFICTVHSGPEPALELVWFFTKSQVYLYAIEIWRVSMLRSPPKSSLILPLLPP